MDQRLCDKRQASKAVSLGQPGLFPVGEAPAYRHRRPMHVKGLPIISIVVLQTKLAASLLIPQRHTTPAGIEPLTTSAAITLSKAGVWGPLCPRPTVDLARPGNHFSFSLVLQGVGVERTHCTS